MPLAVTPVKNAEFDVAVQVHAALLGVTVTFAVPPAAPGDALLAASAYVQPLACVTVYVLPPAVIVPVRAGPVFAAMLKFTVPVPLPLAVSPVIQELAVVAVQAHPAVVLTENDPDEAPAPTEVLADESA